MIQQNPCVVCEVLGQTTQPSKPVGRMFYTISPDPLTNDFGGKLPEKQKRSIDFRFDNALNELNKHLTIYGYSRHYELNKQLNLHIHGIMYIDLDKELYDIWLAKASKIFNREFGRKFMYSNISSKFEWIKDINDVLEYINKENTFPPEHRRMDRNTVKLEDYLLCKKRDGQGLPSPNAM